MWTRMIVFLIFSAMAGLMALSSVADASTFFSKIRFFLFLFLWAVCLVAAKRPSV